MLYNKLKFSLFINFLKGSFKNRIKDSNLFRNNHDEGLVKFNF